MTYDEAIRLYGIDKPDMRLPAMVDLTEELTSELRDRAQDRAGAAGARFRDSAALVNFRGTARKALNGRVFAASLGDFGLDVLDIARLRTSERICWLGATRSARSLPMS